jgi:hypothetical protein
MWPSPRVEHESNRGLPLVRPEGAGYMPLCCAAYWIGTKAGTINLDLNDAPTWEQAFSQLLARISSDEVAVTGVRHGEREKIPGHVFAAIQIRHPFSNNPFDLMFSDELYLDVGAYLDEEHWQRGFDDKLETRSGVKWGKILVLKSDVARWWPFVAQQDDPVSGEPAYRTGAPGRPTSIQLVAIEHTARWDRCEALKSIVAESKALAKWLMEKHPGAPQLAPKTIRNNLGAEHRRRQSDARK